MPQNSNVALQTARRSSQLDPAPKALSRSLLTRPLHMGSRPAMLAPIGSRSPKESLIEPCWKTMIPLSVMTRTRFWREASSLAVAVSLRSPVSYCSSAAASRCASFAP